MTATRTPQRAPRGAAAVGLLSDLDPVEGAAVMCLRLWSEGEEGRRQFPRLWGSVVASDCEALCDLCTRHARRPLMRHALECSCVGADESCFARLVAAAAEGEREDAVLIAMLLVRVEVALPLAELARRVGLGLTRHSIARTNPDQPLH